MVDLLPILEGLAYVGFIAGAIFAVWELRELRQDRKTQLVISMIEKMSSKETQDMARKVYDCEYSTAEEAEEKCGRDGLRATAGWFEGFGYLVEKGLVDREAAFEVMGVDDTWQKMKPWALHEREVSADQTGGSELYVHFERAAEMDRSYIARKQRKGV